jgi:hypothetical protein
MPFSNALLDGFSYDIFYGGGPAPRGGYGDAFTDQQPPVFDSFFGQYYPEFHPYDNPDVASRPPFYDPAMSQQTASGWKEYLIDKGVNAAEQIIGSYIGKVTDKLFDKFILEAYPFAFARAQKTGLPNIGFWFGDVMRVMPDGKWGVVYENVGDLAAFYRYADKLAKVDHFEVGACPHGSEDIPLGLCGFTEYGSAAHSLIAKAGGSTMVFLGFVLISIWLGPKLLKGKLL